MTLRTWLFGQLTTDATLIDFHQGRVFQGGSMTTSKTPKPYVVYHIGNDTNEDLAELHLAHRRFFQIYVHDEVGDYMQVDAVGERLRTMLHGASSAPDRIVLVRFLERSQDLQDEVMQTGFNYLRFQAILSS